jgi:hypothetical protein
MFSFSIIYSPAFAPQVKVYRPAVAAATSVLP